MASSMKKCPCCAEEILEEATKCKFCKTSFNVPSTFESQQLTNTSGRWFILGGVILTILILVATLAANELTSEDLIRINSYSVVYPTDNGLVTMGAIGDLTNQSIKIKRSGAILVFVTKEGNNIKCKLIEESNGVRGFCLLQR